MFRWKMDIGSGYELVYPIYGKDVSLDKEKESGEWFYRETLNGTLTFTLQDWYTIDQATLDTDFNLKLEKNIAGTWTTYWTGIFYKTDCEFDNKHRIIKFKPETNDRYKKLLAGKDNEYDIIKLGPKSESLTYIKRTLNQVYILGSTFVTNIIGKNSYDSSISPPSHDELVSWGFGTGEKYYRIIGDLDVCQYYNKTTGISIDGLYKIIQLGSTPTRPAWMSARKVIVGDVNTFYDPDGRPCSYIFILADNNTIDNNEDFLSVWTVASRNFQFIGKDGNTGIFRDITSSDPGALTPITGTLTHVSGATNTSSLPFTIGFETTSVNYDGVPINPWRYVIQRISDSSYYYLAEPNRGIFGIGLGTKFRSRFSEPSADYVRCFAPTFYSRVLSDLSGTELLDNDFSKNSGYKYFNEFHFTDYFVDDSNTTSENIYGKFSENALFFAGKYFDDKISTRQTIPVSKKDWIECSFWVEPGIIEFRVDKPIVLKDAYKLGDFIKKLIQEIDPTIEHEHDVEYSTLLYGGAIDYFITPKSNIIAGNYDSADSKELLKWSDLRNNLKAIFNADYYINSENKLIIEHVSFFRNGLSLSGKRIGTDIKALKCLETNRSWSFGSNKYKFEKEKIPQRFTFGFMDKTSVVFDGNPIVINNKFAADGVIEDYTASIITTDVDFIQSAPNDINKDGFCLLATSGGVVQIATVNLGTNKVYEIQNGQLAFTNLHEKFWIDNMPAPSITINQSTRTAKSVKRTKLQEIEFPSSVDIDVDGLIRTDLGEGKIKSLKVNIATLSNKISINHDIE
jgi:hypothetical protein